jgi:hypothetical protein
MQATNQWEASLQVVGSKARVSLSATFHKFGEHLMEEGDMEGAVAALEKTSAFSHHIPRMLMAKHGAGMLQHVLAASSLPLKRWYAQYLEVQGDQVGALALYAQCKDDEATVRILCRSGQTEEVDGCGGRGRVPRRCPCWHWCATHAPASHTCRARPRIRTPPPGHCHL